MYKVVYRYLNCWGRPITDSVIVNTREEAKDFLEKVEDLVDYKVFLTVIA